MTKVTGNERKVEVNADKLFEDAERFAAMKPTALDIGYIRSKQVPKVLALPWLANLEALHICCGSDGIGTANIEALAACSKLAKLKTLAVVNSKVSAAHLRTLIASKHFSRLEALDLDFNRNLGGAGARVLAAWPNTKKLRILRLSRCKLTWKDVKPLLVSPRLEELSVGENAIGDEGAEFIATMKAPLRSVTLLDAGVTDRGAEALIASSHRLEWLSLYGNQLSDDVFARLRERFGEALYAR